MEKKISDRKIEANRTNARKSTGPRSSIGKKIASLNATTHGVYGQTTFVQGPPFIEDPLPYVEILESLRVHWQPVGLLENAKVEELAIIMRKKVRLERFENAGITERMWASIDAARNRDFEKRFDSLRQRTPTPGQSTQPLVTAAQLLQQYDLVKGLREGIVVDEDPDFVSFVYFQKIGDENADPSPEELKEVLAGLSEAEKDDLIDRFTDEAERILQAMWENRGATAAEEAALVRTLIPDEAEMTRIIRCSTHLVRVEEKAIAQLKQLQSERRSKEGKQ
jgi:hypothetical protein